MTVSEETRRTALGKLGRAMAPAELERLSAYLEMEPMVMGDRPVRQGDPQDSLLIVGAGELELDLVSGSSQEVLSRIKPGDWTGAAELMEPGPALTTVAVVEAGWLLRLSHPSLMDLRQADPALGSKLLDRLSSDLARSLRRYGTWRLDCGFSEAEKAETRGLWSLLRSLFHGGGER